MRTVIASACCCGVICRWHGRPSGTSRAVRDLDAAGVRVIPVCPEMLGGLPCPRPPVRRSQGRVWETDPATRTTTGQERTAEFMVGAQVAADIARMFRAREAYMFRLSPSCAPTGIAGRILREAGIEVIPIW